MGIFDWLVTSPREREGRKLFDESADLSSSFSDVNNLNDVQSKFGLSKFDRTGYNKNVEDVYGAGRRGLSNALAKSRSSMASRIGSRSASPEFAFSSLEGDFADSFGKLQGDQAASQLQGFDKETEQNNQLADFLKGILGQKDAFSVNKLNTRNKMLKNLSGGSTLDDLLGIGGTVAQMYGAFSDGEKKKE
jgi:hypothetical protein